MAKKISKIISNAKNRLTSKSSASSSKSDKSPSSRIHKSSIRSTASDTNQLLSTSSSLSNVVGDNNNDQICDNTAVSIEISSTTTHQQQQQQDYDDFESPDLNLPLSTSEQRSEHQQQRQQSIEGHQQRSLKSNQSATNNEPRTYDQSVVKTLLSFIGVRSTNSNSNSNTYNELDDDNEHQQQKQTTSLHWWQSEFLLGTETHGPILFGTWNGVFITTVVHLFGVISFLRLGWMIGVDGAPLSLLIVFICLLFNTISLLAAIGIIERCAAVTTATSTHTVGLTPFNQFNTYYDHHHHHQNQQQQQQKHRNFDPDYTRSVVSARANVHILISTVLGSRIGGSISLIYCLGQTVSCALHVTGFSETFVQLIAVFIRSNLITESIEDDQNRSSTNQSLISADHNQQQQSFIRTIARLLHIDIVNQSSSSSTSITETDYQLIINPESFQIVSIVLILILLIINIVGIRWLFRLQTILFLSLVLAVGDFFTGIFNDHGDRGYGPIKLDQKNFLDNLKPQSWLTDDDNGKHQWLFWQQLFETIGVFFPATIGVMAGVNMGSDLERPLKSIPSGSLMAIVSSFGIHILFIIGLSLTCHRYALVNDYQIAQHVSAVGVFFAIGLYMSTISSALGSMYTAPRIMQNLAQELHSLPIVCYFAAGHGPNNIPINALLLFVLATIGFLMIGGINQLAPIVTIPYLLTYATIEYAYFSMAMTFDLQIAREKRFMQIATQLKPSDSDGALDATAANNDEDNEDDDDAFDTQTPSTRLKSKQKSMIVRKPTGVMRKKPMEDTISLTASLTGQTDNQNDQRTLKSPSLSPSIASINQQQQQQSQQHLAGYGSIQSITQHIKIKRRQSTQSSDSDDDDDDYYRQMPASKSVPSPSVQSNQHKQTRTSKPKTIRQLMAAVSNSEDEDDDDDQDDGRINDNVSIKFDKSNPKQSNVLAKQTLSQGVDGGDGDKGDDHRGDDPLPNDDDIDYDDGNINEQYERLLMPDTNELNEITCKQHLWYLRLMNRWIVLVSAVIKVILMFIIAWHYTLVTLLLFTLFLLIIGHTNPGYYPGVSEFSFYNWIRMICKRIHTWRLSGGYRNIIHFGSSTNTNNNDDQMQSNLVASYSYDQIVLPETVRPDFQCESNELTKCNTDYSDRPQCHFTTTINPQLN